MGAQTAVSARDVRWLTPLPLWAGILAGPMAWAFDLTGVRLVPSGLLGLLASLKKLGIEVHLYNPSNDVREVLEITRLDKLFKIHELVM